jgi:hypothetical protein
MAYRRDWIQPQVGPMGFANTMKTIGRTISIVAADNVAANTVGLFKLPAGFTITALLGSATDMDTGGPTMLITIGDPGSANRYVASVSAGAAIVSWTLAATGLFYVVPADTEVILTIATAATTFAAGTVTLYFVGFMSQ